MGEVGTGRQALQAVGAQLRHLVRQDDAGHRAEATEVIFQNQAILLQRHVNHLLCPCVLFVCACPVGLTLRPGLWAQAPEEGPAAQGGDCWCARSGCNRAT